MRVPAVARLTNPVSLAEVTSRQKGTFVDVLAGSRAHVPRFPSLCSRVCLRFFLCFVCVTRLFAPRSVCRGGQRPKHPRQERCAVQDAVDDAGRSLPARSGAHRVGGRSRALGSRQTPNRAPRCRSSGLPRRGVHERQDAGLHARRHRARGSRLRVLGRGARPGGLVRRDRLRCRLHSSGQAAGALAETDAGRDDAAAVEERGQPGGPRRGHRRRFPPSQRHGPPLVSIVPAGALLQEDCRRRRRLLLLELQIYVDDLGATVGSLVSLLFTACVCALAAAPSFPAVASHLLSATLFTDSS